MATTDTKQTSKKPIRRDGFDIISKGKTRAMIIDHQSGGHPVTRHLRRSGLNNWTDNHGSEYFVQA